MRIKSVLLLFLCVVMLISSAKLFEADGEMTKQILFEDDFESYAAGTFPAPAWQLWFSGTGRANQIVDNFFDDSQKQSLRLQGISYWAADAAYPVTSNSPIIGYNVSVRVEQNGTRAADIARVGFAERFWTDTGTEFAPIRFGESGIISMPDYTPLQSFVKGQWYRVMSILDRSKGTVSVWIDDILVADNLTIMDNRGHVAGENIWHIEGFTVLQPYYEAYAYFDDVVVFTVVPEGGSPTPTPISTPNTSPAPTNTPTPLLSPTPTPTPLLPATITLSVESSATYTEFTAKIKGALTANGTGLPNAGILLYLSRSGGTSWDVLSYVDTDVDGKFTVLWKPSVTGNYLLNASWAGDATYSSTSTIVNFAITPCEEENVFSVTSNSTLSGLSFDSANNELYFNVSGPSETTGYINVVIPKSLLADISSLQVSVDGNQVTFSSTSQADSWAISFTYSHSSHRIALKVNSVSSDGNLPSGILIYAIPAAAIVAVIAVIVVFRSKIKRTKEP